MVSISMMMPKAATNLDVEIEGTFGRVKSKKYHLVSGAKIQTHGLLIMNLLL